MKLAMIGGGGFRTPLVYSALLRDHAPGRVTDVALVDVDASRLTTMARILEEQARGVADAPHVSVHTDLAEGLAGADFVFSAIRVGGLDGRARDERIGQAHGVIGQETVGFGGISFALRTLPVVMELARTVARVAPDAWVINFTNPAGIVTEAMSDVLGDRVIGICDSPIGLARRALGALGLGGRRDAELRYAGLNHLGWVTGLRVDGRDVLPDLLARPDLIESFEEGRLFGAEWIQTLGALPNEYLHYFDYRRDVLQADQYEPSTRGRYLVHQQGAFWDRAGTSESPLTAWHLCRHEREVTYMSTNRESAGMGERDEADILSGGYEDVALALMRGIAHDERARLILNVRNRGTLRELDDDAVVEVPCLVDSAGAHPIAGAELPDHGRGLVVTVKYVERQAIEAGVHGSRAAALRALARHPLIDSVNVARALLEDARSSFHDELSHLH
ncbi:MAG: 6-phospho-beta-glucosidase [Actinomyces sp.]|jgi:6-phospho-beta-glucosidase|nr:6-phospho-beta-glucosidase [Actinomyces sp.]MCI1641592.1 6-phospho-beta-glucosidase [Actinomyces sp.]MCI1661670.1 6-phospho-beta-glucosidase [Actinomyces sp.]MCI1691335.1 6-phospho-beta-glucosidase [Actinomyces sp.]MCI1787611.1 6-phospho-beta-glucosidase [Actinomyces sp.]MCI1830181.1 6-phospho-beta-glucosidase [Actinomyces sp.]